MSRAGGLAALLSVLALAAPPGADGFQRTRLSPKGYSLQQEQKGACGRSTRPWFYQLEVDDLARAKESLRRAFEASQAPPLPEGCAFSILWEAGVDKFGESYGESRWIPRGRLELFEKKVLRLGVLQASDEYSYWDDVLPIIPESELGEYERQRAELESGRLRDPVKLRVARDRLAALEPRAAAVRRTMDSELTHVLLVLPERFVRRGAAPRMTRSTLAPTTVARPASFGGAEEERRAMEWFSK